MEYAGQSLRLMALAMGTLKNAPASEVANMDQLQAEQHCGQMDLLGFVVLSNRLHTASKQTIHELQERYSDSLS